MLDPSTSGSNKPDFSESTSTGGLLTCKEGLATLLGMSKFHCNVESLSGHNPSKPSS